MEYRANGKLHSEYAKDELLPDVRAQLDKRAALLSSISEIDERLGKVESAADILDKNLHRDYTHVEGHYVAVYKEQPQRRNPVCCKWFPYRYDRVKE